MLQKVRGSFLNFAVTLMVLTSVSSCLDKRLSSWNAKISKKTNIWTALSVIPMSNQLLILSAN